MCLLKHIITEFFLPFHPKTVNVLWKKANHRSHPEVAAALFVHNEGYFGVWCILVTLHLLPFRQQETRPEHSGFTLVLLCLPACHYMNTARTSSVKQFTSIRGWFVLSVLYQCCCRKTQGVFTRFFWPECLRVQSTCHFLCFELYFLKEISKYVHVLKPNKRFVLLNL